MDCVNEGAKWPTMLQKLHYFTKHTNQKEKKKKMKRERPRETEDEGWGELNYARVENKCETKWKINKLIKAPTRN